jgi:hypothetical protein
MRGDGLTTRTSSMNLASRRAASLGEGEFSSVSATAPTDVPRMGDDGGDSLGKGESSAVGATTPANRGDKPCTGDDGGDSWFAVR